MNNLRVLVIGANAAERDGMRSKFGDRDDLLIPVGGCEEAVEAMSLQKFDGVVVGSSIGAQELAQLAGSLRARSGRSTDRTPLFRLGSPSAQEIDGLDGHLPDGFGPDSLAEALSSLSHAHGSPTGDSASDLPIFALDEFEEQLGGDPEFMTEIIDLYFSEREHQLPAMHDVLAREEYDALSRLAHTLKGSFGSLHATRARARAQELESAAKQQDREGCHRVLAQLDSDLAVLDPQLANLRDSLVAL